MYRALEGKFILLQDEEDDEDEDMTDAESEPDEGSNNTDDSDSASENDEGSPAIESSTILKNKKACPLFRGLHRSKGVFWLATRPNQMGSWSTAGAMLTIGSEMPWFCTVEEDEWMADEDTMKNIKADFDGEWGDRRQELVFIGENLDVEGLRKLLDKCLLSRAQMRKWEGVMHDKSLGDQERDDMLQELWDDSYWAEWGPADDEQHDHEGLGHSHSH